MRDSYFLQKIPIFVSYMSRVNFNENFDHVYDKINEIKCYSEWARNKHSNRLCTGLKFNLNMFHFLSLFCILQFNEKQIK